MTSVDPHALATTLQPIVFPEHELVELARAIEGPAETCIRLRTGMEPSELAFDGTPVAWHPRGLFVHHADRPGARLAFAAGQYYVQDAGSLLAMTLAAIEPGEKVCDLCAAPGGKATAALDDLAGVGWLLANEAVQSRVAPLQFNLARHGATNFVLSRHDPETLTTAAPEFFDVVIVDAPCSGQSLVGRGKRTMASFQAATIDHCARRQKRVLQAATALVRPGGRLVYSTCTFAYAENEARVASFLADHNAWSPRDVGDLAPWRVPDHPGCYRLWPHRDRCAGAFAALLINDRTHDLVSSEPQYGSTHSMARKEMARLLGASRPAESDSWGTVLGEGAVFAARDQIFSWPVRPPAVLLELANQGPEFAFRKQTTWFPSYALAMRRDQSWRPSRRVDLDERAAARFVVGETVATNERGWCVASWRDLPLGWLKADGRFGKNHLPKPGRMTVVCH